MAVRGERILQLGRRHIGEPYVLGSLAPKNNPKWKGPWDCAEFASWLVFQAAGVLYGCASDFRGSGERGRLHGRLGAGRGNAGREDLGRPSDADAWGDRAAPSS